MATEGSTNRQRPRLLLGRSVGCPRSNVALPIFQFSACSEILTNLKVWLTLYHFSFFLVLDSNSYGVACLFFFTSYSNTTELKFPHD